MLSLIFAGKGNGSPKTFGETSLEDFTRNDLQLWLNNLAVKRGESTVKHAKRLLPQIVIAEVLGVSKGRITQLCEDLEDERTAAQKTELERLKTEYSTEEI